MKNSLQSRRSNGFALVVTLSLMILLTIVAVGLLSLSSIALRSSGQAESLAKARANARLALMMALGELQTHAGPDTRITATGSIMENPTESKIHLTGVWDSWKIDPNELPSADDYEKAGGKAQKFRKWLVSSANPKLTEKADFITSSDLPEKERVTLMPEFKGGATPARPVYAGLVPVIEGDTGRSTGSFAYAVFDEGVKARIDTGFKPVAGSNVGDLATAMGSGVRADAARIGGLEKIDWDAADLSNPDYALHKAVSFSNGGLLLDKLGGAAGSQYQELFHDVTTSSLGIFADVANGGLKQDLNSILNAASLPADFSGANDGARVYSSHLGYNVPSYSAASGQVEPSWEQLFEFANLYKSTLRNRDGPYIGMQGPTWRASGATISPPPASATPMLMPSLAKVQLFFSVMAVPLALDGSLTRKPTSNNQWTEPEGGLVGWASTAWDRGARYFIELCMAPCITIHNPYNVNLEVRDLAIELSNIPLSLQINRKRGSAESGWKPRQGQSVDMIDQQARPGDRKYLFNLADDIAGNNRRFVLAPGEVRAFMPTLPPSAGYRSNPYRSWFAAGGGPITMNLAKGCQGRTIGFYFPRVSGNELTGYETYPFGPTGRGSLEYLAPNDQIQFKLRPCLDRRHPPDTPAEIGKVKVTMTRAGAPTMIYSVMHFDIGRSDRDGSLLTGLEKALESPPDGVETEWIPASQIALPNGNTPLHSVPLQGEFALLSLAAKTTHGNLGGKSIEGIMAAKPLAFHSSVSQYYVAAVEEVGLDPYAYEASVIKLDPGSGTGGDAFIENNADGKSYGVSGLTVQRGLPRATIYEIPTGPLQNFAQLNSANVAATNSLAAFTYPIGNSWAHPMISPNSIMASAPNSTTGNAYDHSFLLNSLLYDKFYFSGIAPRTGRFMTAVSTGALAKSFIEESEQGQLHDKRLIPYLPDGETGEQAIDALSMAHENDPAASQARFGAAAHQLMKGAFNVNSTSKQAWKAMLASLHAENGKMLQAAGNSPEATLVDLKDAGSNEVRFSRFLLPNNDAPENSGDVQNVFQGPRDISDAELDALAGQIVAQVRLRGPFLSMAEFVNRQIGTSALAQNGALQAAIDATQINASNSVLTNAGYELPLSSKYPNPDAMTGRSDQGAAGYLCQSDLLTVLGNAATVRSDTFTVRAYGNARDAAGKITAQAWCEAIVQRVPEYIDPEDKAQVGIADLNSSVNRTFGRKFVIQSFRWLASRELEPVT